MERTTLCITRVLGVSCWMMLLLGHDRGVQAQHKNSKLVNIFNGQRSLQSYPDCDGIIAYIADGDCDESNNNAQCAWDGGDCCRCTCEDTVDFTCGGNAGFECLDPDAPIDCGTDSPTPSPAANTLNSECGGIIIWIGDAYCDADNNNDECGWDGGDCCRCTCEDTDAYDCGVNGFECLEPDALIDCTTDSPTPSPAANSPYPKCDGTILYIADGECDENNNNADCVWDGGDCCSCQCVDNQFQCGVSGFSCQDPAADCFGTTSQTDDFSYWYSYNV